MATVTFGTEKGNIIGGKFVADEHGLEVITSVTIDGKFAKKSYMNALLKAQETKFWHIYGDDQSHLEDAVRDWVFDWQRYYSRGVMPGMQYRPGCKLPPVSVFDNMRYLFMAMNYQRYMNIMD